jgi:MoaA/NifB/PqqE/SkfB family radical SAM enzyme
MYSPFRYAGAAVWKKRPIHLTFFLTRRCNSHCPFCFYLKNQDNTGDSSAELSLEEIARISPSFGDLLWLAFSGGEIFLREDLVEISRIFYENNRPAIMLFPTNGLLPGLISQETAHILENSPKSVVAVKLSLDGVGEDHDRLRNTPGSFEKTMETYRLLRGFLEKHRHFELGVNTVFCSENQDRMDGIIDFVRGLPDIKTHTISLVRGNLADAGYKDVDFLKYQRAVARLERNLKDKTSSVYRFRGARIKAAQDILQGRMIHRTMREGKRVTPCYAGRLNLVLGESGEVFPCEILTTSFGNIRDHDYDIARVLGSREARRVIGSIADKGCYCTHECYFMTNILFNPRLYPALLREYLQLR